MTTQDPFNLKRFLDAQENDYADALREIKQGYKQYLQPCCNTKAKVLLFL